MLAEMHWIMRAAEDNAAFAAQQAFKKYFVLRFHQISLSSCSFGILSGPAIKYNQFCACSHTEGDTC